ncbi:hypothetical protein RHGRI_024988 [Rhododendron griersonianum]|uniref:Uncharacterized protein n=1 Tax=Rhododendron griersonianum TaxID=479676 RepID=A0AAV6J9G0_9ERIC|nr:hypothetical protein RHGRI_024988 [Rhododendron griersonianum]
MKVKGAIPYKYVLPMVLRASLSFVELQIKRFSSGHKMIKPQSNAVGSMSAAGRSVVLQPVEESIAYFSHLKKTCKSSGSKIKQSEGSHDTEGAFAFSDSPVNLSIGIWKPIF